MVPVVVRLKAPPKYPHPNPENLWIYYVTQQKGFCRCDLVKDQDWDREPILNYPGWPMQSQGSLSKESKTQSPRGGKQRLETWFEVGGRSRRPSNVGARGWKRPGNSPSPRASRRSTATPSTWALTHWNSFFFLINFIYVWLLWVFVAVHGLSLVVASGGFSLWWLLLVWSTGSRPMGFSSCSTQAQ